MSLTIELARASEDPELLSTLANLRIQVFRDFPYLYDGDLDYEKRYLRRFSESDGAIIVLAKDGPGIVGVSTGAPLAEHEPEFKAPLVDAGLDPKEVFYCAESVLLQNYRGQRAGHAFFDQREAHARECGLSRVALDVAASNKQAIEFYKRGNMLIESKWPRYFSLPGLTFYRMIKPV